MDRSLIGFFGPNRPFGPTVTPKEFDQAFFDHVFDKKNTIYDKLGTRPNLIVGRRGSGKSAFLSSHLYNSQYDITILMDTDEEFPRIIRKINQSLPENILAEEVCTLWIRLFWSSIFNELINRFESAEPKSCALLSQYLEVAGVKSGMSIYKVMRAVLDAILSLNEKSKILRDAIDALAKDGIDFDSARGTAYKIIKNRNLNVVILIDSLEQFPLNEETMKNALSGLLKAVSEFNRESRNCEVRCCIPSELYPRLTKISSNPEKDFANNILIHWQRNEIIHLASVRIKTFAELFGIPRVAEEVRSYDLSNKNDIAKLWSLYFPTKIKNRLGITEYTIPYILRHTQMLPRQLLSYMNSIGKIALVSNGKLASELNKASSDQVIRGVVDEEHMVCEGILNGYRQVYPDASHLCDVLLPNLPMVFEIGTFQVLYRQQKGTLNQHYDDFHEALQILVEIGALGIVTNDNENKFEASFEYAVPNRLRYGGDALFCVHPAFIQEYRVSQNNDPKEYKPIYPSGIEIDIDSYEM